MTTPIPPDARALTIRQPWASLIALGAKTIETRSWPTAYRGPLVIHAGKAEPESFQRVGEWVASMNLDGSWSMVDRKPGTLEPVRGADLPLGAVVAVVDLVDVVPIVDLPEYVVDSRLTNPEVDRPYAMLPPTYVCGNEPALWLVENGGRYISQSPVSIADQLPYGDFTPGRYAWLLDNVRPVDPPIPAKGRQGLWRWNP